MYLSRTNKLYQATDIFIVYRSRSIDSILLMIMYRVPAVDNFNIITVLKSQLGQSILWVPSKYSVTVYVTVQLLGTPFVTSHNDSIMTSYLDLHRGHMETTLADTLWVMALTLLAEPNQTHLYIIANKVLDSPLSLIPWVGGPTLVMAI